MPQHTAPVDLYRRSLDLLLAKDISAWVDLWADDAVMEFPFAPEGWPGKLDGREAIAAYMQAYPEHIDLHEFLDVRIHETDLDTIIVEMRGVGRLVESGGPFDMRYIAVVTVREGKIVSCRDYWNPLMAGEPGADFTRSGR